MKIRAGIGLLYLLKLMKLFILVVLAWNIFLKKLINLLVIKKLKRIQAYDSIMYGYFCIEFINYMLKGKTLLDYTNLFSPNDFKKNDQIIKRIFKNE